MGFISKTAKELGLKPIEKWHTPFMTLDFSLGKGFGEGVWVEIFAPEGLGKTTLMLQSAFFYLDQNPDAELLFFDVEKALDFTLIENISFHPVEVDYETGQIFIEGEHRATFTMPDTYEDIEKLTNDFIEYLTKEKKKGIVIWDSLVSAVTQNVLTKGNDTVAYKAKKIQDYIEKYMSTFRKVPITFLVINQIRDKVATGFVMGQDKSAGAMVDADYHIPGGRAHKFYSFQSLMLIPGAKWQYSTTSDLQGRIIKTIPTKNKQAPDRREVRLIRLPEYGFSNILTILNFLKENKKIEGTMATLKLPEELMSVSSKKGNKTIKLPDLLTELVENPEFLEAFYEFSAQVHLAHYKEQKRFGRIYDKDIQKRAIVLDAMKLQRYLEEML